MLVVAIVSRRAPLRMGDQDIEAQAAVIVGEGVVGDDLAYAAWNAADKTANITLSDTNHTATSTDGDPGAVRADQFRDTGKWYYECDMVSSNDASSGIGLAKGDAVLEDIGPSASDCVIWLGGGGIFVDEVFQINIGGIGEGRLARIAYDADAHLIWIQRDDEGWNGDEDADPALGTGGFDVSGIDMDGLYPVWASGATGLTVTANFGETPFTYTKPDGFLPWFGGTIASGVSAEGALVSGAATIEGAGTSGSTGTGELAAQAAAITGTGTNGNAGSLEAEASTIEGEGTSGSTGTGELESQAAVVEGEGEVTGGDDAFETPDYTNAGGTGNRTALITVTTSATLGAGTASNLVDGAKANNDTDAMWWNSGQTLRHVTYDFGHKVLITEAKWFQNGTSESGTWKWQGSDDGSIFTDLSANFTLDAGSTGSVMGDLSANVTGYRHYRQQQVSGNTTDAPWLWETEFKIGNIL